MKKIIALLLATMLALGLGACDGDSNLSAPSAGQQDSSAETAMPSSATPDSVASSKSSSGAESSRLVGGGADTQRFPLEIIESGYGFATWSDSSLTYGVRLYNPNEDALEFPSFRVTARRDDNSIIGTDERVLNIIYPGQTLTIGGVTFDVIPEEVYSVDFDLVPPDDRNWTAGDFVDFETINLHLSEGRYEHTATGEISNPNGVAYDTVRVDVIFRDSNGSIVGGDSTFVDSLPANGTVPFEIGVRSSITKNIEGEWEVQVFASPW